MNLPDKRMLPMGHFMRVLRLLCSILAAVSVSSFQGCSWKGTRDSDNDDGKLRHEVKTNLVGTVTLERDEFRRELVANGRLSARARSSMSFSSPGVIAEINAGNGDIVTRSSVIARQDASEKLLSLESARIALAKAELDFKDVLAGQGYMSSDTSAVPESVIKMARMRSGYDAALNSLRKAELEYDGTVIRAPFSGRVADIKLKEYDMSGSDPFCILIDDSVLDVDFSILESEYTFIRKGLKVKVIPFSGEHRILYGEITAVNPTVDKNGQISVTASIENDGSLIDGMNVRIAVERTVPGMLVVPKSAVVIRDNEEVLFVYSKGKARWTYVNVLMSNSTEYAVEANADRGAELAEGDSVIVSGNLNLADGSEVELKY